MDQPSTKLNIHTKKVSVCKGKGTELIYTPRL